MLEIDHIHKKLRSKGLNPMLLYAFGLCSQLRWLVLWVKWNDETHSWEKGGNTVLNGYRDRWLYGFIALFLPQVMS